MNQGRRIARLGGLVGITGSKRVGSSIERNEARLRGTEQRKDRKSAAEARRARALNRI